ncbi:hypothetical protein [Thiomonas arsenitoxydans]|uniref:hypothetical protein n=1 Tax=Thiomonas arsenitoxydans (strain DSM 22701 / CIP 110005 / 3As) TaxID=426114 RepID=UPI002D1FB3DF|nr:hypothetical protein [Thiomonas arsenitoxydans]
MDRYSHILCSLLEKYPARICIEDASRLILGKGKVAGYELLKTSRFPVPVYGGQGERHYVRIQDIAEFLSGEHAPDAAQQTQPPLGGQRRVGRPTRAEQLAEERRRALRGAE